MTAFTEMNRADAREIVESLRGRLLQAEDRGAGVRLAAIEAEAVAWGLDILGQHFEAEWLPSHAGEAAIDRLAEGDRKRWERQG